MEPHDAFKYFKAYVSLPTNGGRAEQKKVPDIADKLIAKLGSE